MSITDFRLPQWLLRTIRCYQRQLQLASGRYEIEPCERRVLLTTFPITGIGQGNPVNLSWNITNSEVALTSPQILGGTEIHIPSVDSEIDVDGTAGENALTVDFSNGAFEQASGNPSIHFNGDNGSGITLYNTLTVIGSSNDSVVLNPGSVVFKDSSSRSTTIDFGSGVSQLTFELGSDSNSVDVEGGASFTFDSTSFPSASNPGTLAVTVGSSSSVYFTQSQALSSLDLEGTGFAKLDEAMSPLTLSTNSLTVGSSAKLDLTDGELDVDYGSGADPASDIRADLGSV